MLLLFRAGPGNFSGCYLRGLGQSALNRKERIQHVSQKGRELPGSQVVCPIKHVLEVLCSNGHQRNSHMKRKMHFTCKNSRLLKWNSRAVGPV